VPVNLTLGMRILLHLSAFDPSREAYDLPADVTQQGIADALGVRQSDVSRAVARMKADGQVEERISSIGPGRAGRKQRLKVYFLSGTGREMAQSLAARLQELVVTLPPAEGGGEQRRVPLREVNRALGTGHPLLRLAGMVSPEGALVPPAPRPAPGHEGAMPGPPRTFVGRTGELSALLDRIRNGPEAVLVVTGIAGVGKTALAGRLLSELGGRPGFYFRVRGWADAGRLLGALGDFLQRSGRRRLAALLRKAGPPPGDGVAEALRRDLDGLGAVLVLDDFHESDGQPELVQLARELSDIVGALRPPCRLLIFSRTAPGFYDLRDIRVRRAVWELALDGLDETSSRELAAASGVPAEAASAVFRSTRGHPLSILLLGGVPGSPGGPADHRQFIQEEVIGRIPAGERSMLQLLSVLRRPESSAFVLGMSDDALAFDALSALVSRSLAQLSGGGYEVHDMVRGAAYGRLPETARRGLHARAAALYLKAGGAEAGAEAVHHFLRGGEPDRAAQLLLSLGGELIAGGRLEECRSLLDLVGAGAQAESEGLGRLRQDLLAAYGDWDLGYEHLFQYTVLERATGLRIGAPGRRTRTEKEWAAAISDHERGLAVLARMGDLAGRCELLSSLGWMRLVRGEHRQAADAFRNVLRSAEGDGCREASLKAGVGLGHIAWLAGKGQAAATRYSATMRRLGPGDAGLRIACLNYIAGLATTKAELSAACRRLEEALELCGRGRHRRERAYTLLHLGRARSLAGLPDAALGALRAALAEFAWIGDLHGVVFSELALSVHCLSTGDREGAHRLAASARGRCSAPELGAAGEYAARLGLLSAPEKGPPAQGRGTP
jgi:DNA-binding MarR family transcriptional regulator